MFTTDRFHLFMDLATERILSNKAYLNDLDRAIGDNDHGSNMARGFTLALEKTKSLDGAGLSDLFKNVAMVLISNVGGASGPLYGTAFLSMAKASMGKDHLDERGLLEVLDAAIEGVKKRGNSDVGAKTMLDALVPAKEAYARAIDGERSMAEATKDAVKAAEEGVAYTKTIIATKGRASYLGERSIGHQDPGATSSLLLLEALHESLSNGGVS